MLNLTVTPAVKLAAARAAFETRHNAIVGLLVRIVPCAPQFDSLGMNEGRRQTVEAMLADLENCFATLLELERLSSRLKP